MERVSHLVPQLEGCLVVEREAVRRTRDKRKKERGARGEKKNQHEHVRTGTPTRKFVPFQTWLRRDPYGAPDDSECGKARVGTVCASAARPAPYNRDHRYDFRVKGGSTWHGNYNGVHTSEEMGRFCLGMKSPSFFEVRYIGMATRRRSASSPLNEASQARMIAITRRDQQTRLAATLT
jgi:hypothetical protein